MLPDRLQAPLSICMVVPYDLAEEGGVKRHAVHLARSLRNLGDEVTVMGPLSRGVAGPHIVGFGGVLNIPSNGAANFLGVFASPWRVRRFFSRSNFDVVHVHEPFVPMLPYYGLWLSPRAAHVCTFHMYAEREGTALRWLRPRLGSLIHESFERAIAVSESARVYAASAWRSPIAVIPNGVPTTLFRPEAGRRARADDAPLRLLFVGHWRDPRKGLPSLLSALARLRASGLQVTLDVVGEGPRWQQISMPQVVFHGPVASEAALAEHYRRCDIFVSPALGQESFGIVLLEAMATALPIVCSAIDGYRQVAATGGACLVPPGDVEALARAISALAGQPERRDRMGERNRELAQGYEWDLVARDVRAQYLAALDVRRRSNPPATATESAVA